MKTVSITVLDHLAERIHDYVQAGFFMTEPDDILAAISFMEEQGIREVTLDKKHDK